MANRLRWVLLAWLCAAGLGAWGCACRTATDETASPAEQEANRFRAPGPRQAQTIFSPLPWPAASDLRLASGVPGPAYWQNRADHRIEAALDAEQRVVEGREVIVYHNNSPHDLDYIWLHLEQNLFHPESRGARMTTPGARFGNRDDFVGGFELSRVAVRPAGGGDWLDRSDLHVHDTLGRVDLDGPLGPGERVEIAIEWTFNVPPYGSDRMGVEEVEQGTIFQLAQWFPTVVKYDDVHGWNTMPYLGAGEFYTEFGDYEVAITVPREYLVGATGMLVNADEVLTSEQLERLERARQTPETVVLRSAEEVGRADSRPDGEGPLTWRFAAEDVRTFAWTASDAFIWDAATVRGGEARTLVQSLYPKEALPLWEQSTEMLRFAIEGYNDRWFEYPYPAAINVNGIVGGMEYPMIIFCRNRTSERGLYGVTTHEIGHNWFPMIVSTDERRHVWMDEGFNSFINIYSNMEWWGEDGPSGRGNPRGIVEGMLREEQQPIVTYPDQIRAGRLGFLGYAKPATGLYILREYVLGHERFDFAFRRYIHEWAFKSPQPADFFRCMEDGAGEDLTWFWRGWFYETGVLDQAVAEVTDAESIRAGFAERAEEGRRRRGPRPEDIPDDLVRVRFLNERELVLPLEFEVTYDDGTSELRRLPVEIWFGGDEWTTQWRTGGRRIVRIVVDPRELTPDVDPGNNVWEAPAEANSDAIEQAA